MDAGNVANKPSDDDKHSDNDLRQRKSGVGEVGPFVHFFTEKDEPKSEFPVQDDEDDDGVIHIKAKRTTPDILKIAQ